MEDFKRLDGVISVAYANIFTLSKSTKKIIFWGFDPKNKSHLAMFYIASGAETVFNIEVKYEFSFFKSILFKIKHKTFKRYRKKKDGCYNICFKNIDDFIGYIEKANNEEGIFERVYEAYFKKK